MTDEPSIPGGLYLCQVNDRLSCAACCGLYNNENPSFSTLSKTLEKRTRTFAETPRTEDAILHFAARHSPQNPPIPDFHACPFTGFLDSRQKRVGCLLHPASIGNKGIDYRGLSWYGGLACRTYFCPPHLKLSLGVKQILLRAIPDWHLYGLILAETRLLNAYFQSLTTRVGFFPDPARLNDAALSAVRSFLEWKRGGLFSSRIRSAYVFDESRHPPPSIDYPAFGAAPSAFDDILSALSLDIESAAQLKEAEEVLEHLLGRAASAILDGGPTAS